MAAVNKTANVSGAGTFNLEKAIKANKSIKAEDIATIYNSAKRAGVNSSEALAKFIKKNVSILAKG